MIGSTNPSQHADTVPPHLHLWAVSTTRRSMLLPGWTQMKYSTSLFSCYDIGDRPRDGAYFVESW